MIGTPNHVINIYEMQYFDLWRSQTSWTTGFRCWHLQSLCDKDASYSSKNLNFFWRNTGPVCKGATGLSPASPIANPGLGITVSFQSGNEQARRQDFAAGGAKFF